MRAEAAGPLPEPRRGKKGEGGGGRRVGLRRHERVWGKGKGNWASGGLRPEGREGKKALEFYLEFFKIEFELEIQI